MGIFLRQSHNVKPSRWGSFADVQYAIRVNSEKIYGCDPDDDVLVMPLFWGLPCLDYSGYNNHGTNHGATYKNGSLNFDNTDDYISCGNKSRLNNLTSFSLLAEIKPTDWGEAATGGYIASKGGIAKMYGRIGDSSIDGEMSLFINRATPQYTVINGGLSLNKRQSVAYIWDGGINAADLKVYANGIEKTAVIDSRDGSGAPVSDTTEAFIIGNRDSDLARTFGGYLLTLQLSKAVRTADQIALFNDRPWDLYRRVARPIWSIPAAPPVGAIMNQFQGANLGADLFNGTLL